VKGFDVRGDQIPQLVAAASLPPDVPLVR